MNGVRSVLGEILDRWDRHGLVTNGAFQFLLEGPETVNAYVLVEDGAATLHDGVHATPIGIVALPAVLLERLFAEGETFDPRVLDHDTQNAIRFAGDATLLNALMYMLRRPRADAARRIQAAETKAASRPRLRSIERIHRPSIADLVDAMRASLPLVATGSIDGWAVETWSLDRLAAELGAVPLHLLGSKRTFGEFIRDMQDASRTERLYTEGCPLPPELGRVFEPPFFARDLFFPQLWMGVGTDAKPITLLHRDLSDAFLAQLAGRKRVVFYSPDQAACLYPFRNFNTYQRCWVDSGAPDLQRFPLFSEAEPVDVTLEPGDVLLNPAGWFHCVYALGATLSMSFTVRGGAVHAYTAEAA